MTENIFTDNLNKKTKLNLNINQSEYFNTSNKDLSLIDEFTNNNKSKFIIFNIKTYISKLNMQIKELKLKNSILTNQSNFFTTELEKEELVGELIKVNRLTNRLDEAYKEEFNELNNELKKYKLKYNNLEVENRSYKAIICELIKRIKPQNEAENIIEELKKDLFYDKLN